MPLETIAAHRGATPAVLSHLTAAALAALSTAGDTSALRYDVPYALLRNEHLGHTDTVALLEAVPRPAAAAGLARRDGLSPTQVGEYFPLILLSTWNQVCLDWDLPAPARTRVRTYLRSHLSGPTAPHTDWGRDLLRDPDLDPTARLQALYTLIGDPLTFTFTDLVVTSAAMRHPDHLRELTRRAVSPSLAAMLRRAVATSDDAAHAGTDPFEAWLTDILGTFGTDRDFAVLLRAVPVRSLAMQMLAPSFALSREAREVVLELHQLPQDVREAALTRWPGGIPRWRWQEVTPIISAASPQFLDAFITAASTEGELRAAMACTHLTAAHLDALCALHTTLDAQGEDVVDTATMGAWLATHPGASPTQRAAGLRAAHSVQARAHATAGVLLVDHGPASAGGHLPVQSLSAGQSPSTNMHIRALGAAFLAQALPTVRTAAQAATLTALAPTFTGTLTELFDTVNTLTSTT